MLTNNFLRNLDKVLCVSYFTFFSYWVLKYFTIFLSYLVFCISVGVLFYGTLFLLYLIPHWLRDLSSSYVAEDIAEQRMEDDVIVFEKADLAIIEFWDYSVHHNFFFEYWRGNYWLEELDEEWDWMHRRGFSIKRYEYYMAHLCMEYDWYTNMPNATRMIPMGAFPEYWPEEADVEDEGIFKKILLIAEEKEWIQRQKGLHNPSTVERHNYYTRWWKFGKRKAKILSARNVLLESFFDDQELPELQVVEEGERSRSTANRERIFFTLAEDPSYLAWVRKQEEIILNDDEWEYSDE